MKICYGNQNCPYEITSGPNWGDCGKPPHGVCQDMYENEEDFLIAQDEAAEYADLAAEARWEQQQERRNE